MLQVLTITATADGSVDQIKIAGQNLNTTDQPGHVSAFSEKSSNDGAKNRYIGIAVRSQQASTLAIDGTLDGAGGDINISLSVHPMTDAQVPSVESQAIMFNYFSGLGQVAIAPASTGQLRATTTRATTLGQLILASDGLAPDNQLQVQSIEVNGLEMLAGNNDQSIFLNAYSASIGDVKGNEVNAQVDANAVIIVTIKNSSAVVGTVRGTIFNK